MDNPYVLESDWIYMPHGSIHVVQAMMTFSRRRAPVRLHSILRPRHSDYILFSFNGSIHWEIDARLVDLWSEWRKNSKSFALLPGPKGYPIIDNIFDFFHPNILRKYHAIQIGTSRALVPRLFTQYFQSNAEGIARAN